MWRGSERRAAAGLRALLPVLGVALLILGVTGCEDEHHDLRPPAAPQGVFSVTGDGQVTVHWIRNTEPDFDHYLVWRGPDYEGPYEKLGGTVETDFVDGTAVNGTTYFYAVSAVDREGNESSLSAEHVFDTPRPEGFGLALANAAAYPDGASGYDFSDDAVRRWDDYRTDVYYYVTSTGVRLLVAPNVDTNVQDAGYNDLDALDWAPDAGWSPTGEVELIPGHAYYVVTRTNNYAKVRVTAIDNTRVVLDWAYQLVAGNPELKPVHPQIARR